jgi:UDP-N-acetylglucosamine 2-epimerase (hydrolysing)
MKKKIVFLTGTRADFGKLKSLIAVAQNGFEVHIFATGMHMDMRYGFTVKEIEKCGYENIFKYINHDDGASMDITLSRTIEGFANYIHLIQPDLIVIHGDRIEALAGATVGALNNILVAHIEGGEVSGTVDELIRHAVSKLSHVHLVANNEAKLRLLQMGEKEQSVFVIGSPDMDAMLSTELPGIDEVKRNYEIEFDEYAISMFHPVTTEYDKMGEYAGNYIQALIESQKKYIVIYPNNDKGSEFILNKLKKIEQHINFRIFPSVRFEAFLVMMKNANFIIGNSSAGIREAPYYGIPTVNVGTRQNGRSVNNEILHTNYEINSIVEAIKKTEKLALYPQQLFGDGKSDEKFLSILQSENFWSISKQKIFTDKF